MLARDAGLPGEVQCRPATYPSALDGASINEAGFFVNRTRPHLPAHAPASQWTLDHEVRSIILILGRQQALWQGHGHTMAGDVYADDDVARGRN